MQAVAADSGSLIVTSPPYLNNFDFAEMARMYLYFWEMPRRGEKSPTGCEAS